MTVVTTRFENDLAFVTIDNPPVNATSTIVRAGLMEAVARVAASDVRAAILSCAGRTFIAGGDMSEFDAPPMEPHLPDVVAAIESCPVPWIAAMHGNVLGGGFEIAMGCAFRIAAAGTRFGLPEVNVGLIPGAGGTQRLPRLIGVEAAIDMCCSGTPRGAADMLALGGIDAVVEGDPVQAARGFAADLPPRPEAVRARAIALPEPEFFGETRLTIRKRAKGQAAPLHNFDAVKWACETDFASGQKRERELHLALRNSAESRALRHAFFAERTVAKPEAIKGVTPREVKHVAIVGGGLMGAGIAAACLNGGLQVTMIERDAEAAEAGAERVRGILDGAVKRGKSTVEERDALLEVFTASADFAAAKGAGLAIEAVFEDLDVKRAVFAELAAVMDPQAILATNTSYLDPREVFDGVANPERCLGLHFFSPAHIMKLLEIVKTPETSAGVLATGFALGKRLRKVGVLSGICDGFIGNRMLAAYRRQADYLLADGCLPYQIDAAMRAFGMPMGPYELQDLTGLQIAWANRKRQAATRDPAERYIPLGDMLCEDGRLGQRAGKGWYRYDGGRKPVRDGEVEALIEKWSADNGIERADFSQDQIANLILAAMINEGARIVEEGIAERPLDVDMVQIHGYGFPRWRGGPMHYAEEVGVDEISVWMGAVSRQSPGSWKISTLLS